MKEESYKVMSMFHEVCLRVGFPLGIQGAGSKKTHLFDEQYLLIFLLDCLLTS